MCYIGLRSVKSSEGDERGICGSTVVEGNGLMAIEDLTQDKTERKKTG